MVGFLADTHVYENHISALEEQVQRMPKGLPRIDTPLFSSIFDWQYTDTQLLGYESYGVLPMPVAV